jgi:hypothetical protein
MKRRDIARKLVKHLETHALTFKEVQQFIWKKTNGIPQKEKIDVCRGYWCNNLTQLFNSQRIGKHPKFGYFALPGASKQERMFDKYASPHAYEREKNQLHLQVFKHPGIRKKIEKEGTLHEYI